MADNYLPSVYQQYIYKSRYARYLDSESRRENWDETVARYFDYFETFKIDWERIDTGFLLYCNDGIVRVDINDTVTLRVNGDIKIQRGN